MWTKEVQIMATTSNVDKEVQLIMATNNGNY